MNKYLASVIENVKKKHANEPEFVQTVEEVLSSLEPVIEKHPEYEKLDILNRIVEPERMFTFRVVWEDDKGEIHTNIGYRCQFNGAIGPYKGDMGVGGREIGFLYGEYRRLKGTFENGVLTGKGFSYGGSLIRPEATGYGAVYYLENVLKHDNVDIKGKTIAASGFGNVCWGICKKAAELGAKVLPSPVRTDMYTIPKVS